MNFVTEDEVIIYSENSEDESKHPHRTDTSPTIIRPEITTQVVNMSTIKAHKSHGNVQKLSTGKWEDLILLRVKYFESENKFLKDEIFNKQNLIDKLLENKLVDHQSHHVPVQYIQGSQSGTVNGSRSLNVRKYRPVDNIILQVSNNKENSNNKEIVILHSKKK